MTGPAVIACLACLAATLGCAAPKPPQQPRQQPGTGEEQQVVVLLNQKRAEAGCSPVNPDDRLTAAARRQANDMMDKGVRDHTGSDGSGPRERIEAAGFTPVAATGEILLWGTGSTSPQQEVDAWMASPPHREVIEECIFTDAGAAVLQADSHYFAVVAFARPA